MSNSSFLRNLVVKKSISSTLNENLTVAGSSSSSSLMVTSTTFTLFRGTWLPLIIKDRVPSSNCSYFTKFSVCSFTVNSTGVPNNFKFSTYRLSSKMMVSVSAMKRSGISRSL